MESCYGGMSTRMKQRAVTEFLNAENVTPAEIHRRLQSVYGEDTVNRTTVNRWAIKFRKCEPGRANIVDQPRSGRPFCDRWQATKTGWWTDQAWPPYHPEADSRFQHPQHNNCSMFSHSVLHSLWPHLQPCWCPDPAPLLPSAIRQNSTPSHLICTQSHILRLHGNIFAFNTNKYKICSVVDQEFERVRDFKYFPLILMDDDVKYWEVRTVTANEEMTELRIFRKRGKMYSTQYIRQWMLALPKREDKNIYTKPLKEEY